mgnify:CR=1 FL=1
MVFTPQTMDLEGYLLNLYNYVNLIKLVTAPLKFYPSLLMVIDRAATRGGARELISTSQIALPAENQK